MKRYSLTLMLAPLLLIGAGCASYDRELLGDPKPIALQSTESDYDEPASYDIDQPAAYDYDPPAPVENEPAMGATAGAVVSYTSYRPARRVVAVDPRDMFVDLTFWGTWYHLDGFGSVWRPSLVLGWRPFENGRWVHTTYGWMFESYDTFGWITYHYGNWFYSNRLGWVWVPGYEWVACNCDWMRIDDIIFWAPLPPVGYVCPRPWEPRGGDWWIGVRGRNFEDDHIGNYRVPPVKFKSERRKAEVIHRGPDTKYVETITRRPVKTISVDLQVREVRGRKITRVKMPSDRTKPPRYTPAPIRAPQPTPQPVVRKGTQPRVTQPPSGSSGGTVSRPAPVKKQPAPVERKSTPSTSKSRGSSDSGKATPAKAKSKGSSSSKGSSGSKSKNEGGKAKPAKNR